MDSEGEVFFLRANFSGRVQGVGFRYTTLQIAKGFEVTGQVRNLIDGRVELEVEGSESECRAFLKEIESEMDSYVRETTVREELRKKFFKRFEIV